MSRSTDKAIHEVQDIPTLDDLYTAGEVGATEEEEFGHDELLNKRVSIWRGDITTLKAGMIVNAANSSLLGGGGVDGAIHRAAGPELLDECEGLGGAETGETKVTKGYELPAEYIAHTVGPIYSRRNPDVSEAALIRCYASSLQHAKDKKAKSIGFSSISTGVYGYPIYDATEVALQTTRQFLEQDDTVERVIYVVFSAKDERVYRELAPIYFPPATASAAAQAESGAHSEEAAGTDPISGPAGGSADANAGNGGDAEGEGRAETRS